MRRWFPWLALALAVGVHGLDLVGPVWAKVRDAGHARDFASYYYAAQAAAQGQDPYDARVLGTLARQDKTRSSVHPFFYPPPYLLTVAWTLPLELSTAFRVWFVLDSLFLLAVLLALWRWVPGPATVLAVALILATYTPIPDNHWMGQANLPVLALACWGLWLQHRGRSVPAGLALGLASMMKMSPGLLVLWWFLDPRSRRAAWIACATAVGLSVATLPLLGLGEQLRFFTHVLPGFATGDYNGLTVPITLSGNHSIANLWAQVLPGDGGLGAQARLGTRLTTAVGLGATLAALVRARGRIARDDLGHAGAAGVLLCWMVVVPAYAYEHHLVFLIPAIGVTAAALASGRLGLGWLLALGPAYAALAWRLGGLRSAMRDLDGVAAWALQECKFAGIVVLGVACLVVALRSPAVPPRAAGPGARRGTASTAATGPSDSALDGAPVAG